MAYTEIDDPSEYFQTKLYTGTGSSLALTNDGNSDLQPDWIWIKGRDFADSHHLTNTSVGLGTHLRSNTTNGDYTNAQVVTAVASDGFTVGSDAGVNTNTKLHVAWQWKANGGTTASNTDGSITSTVQANTDAGFSIVTYTGTGSNATVGHGLGGKVPAMIIFKNRNATDVWIVYHHGLASDAETDFIILNRTDAKADNATVFNDTAPTSSVFSIGSLADVNRSSSNIIAYCFAEKKGYSKFGSYTGNANADGAFVYTGFKPAWLMVKRTDSSQNWAMYDNKRNDDAPAGANVIDRLIYPNANDAEVDTGGSLMVDFLSNGFKMRGTSAISNGSGTHIYMAFAEHPFVSSKGVPTTAR